MSREDVCVKYNINSSATSCILALVDELVELERQLKETQSSHVKTKRDIVSLMSEIQKILVRDYKFRNSKISESCNGSCECK